MTFKFQAWSQKTLHPAKDSYSCDRQQHGYLFKVIGSFPGLNSPSCIHLACPTSKSLFLTHSPKHSSPYTLSAISQNQRRTLSLILSVTIFIPQHNPLIPAFGTLSILLISSKNSEVAHLFSPDPRPFLLPPYLCLTTTHYNRHQQS